MSNGSVKTEKLQQVFIIFNLSSYLLHPLHKLSTITIKCSHHVQPSTRFDGKVVHSSYQAHQAKRSPVRIAHLSIEGPSKLGRRVFIQRTSRMFQSCPVIKPLRHRSARTWGSISSPSNLFLMTSRSHTGHSLWTQMFADSKVSCGHCILSCR